MLDHIFYYVLVYFDSPDGSTCWVIFFYYILVYFDSPDGNMSWVIFLLYFSLF